MKQRFFRSLLINKSFQFRFVGFALLASAALTLVYLITALIFFANFESLAHRSGFAESRELADFIAGQRSFYFKVMFGSFFVVGALTAFFGLWFSHRVAGPIYRLTLSLKQMHESGKLQYIYFRRSDFFQEIPTEFNRLIKKLSAADTGDSKNCSDP